MKNRRASVSVNLIRTLLKYASEIRPDFEGICRTIGLEPKTLKDTEARIPIEQSNALWKEVALWAKDQNFGLHFGEASHNLFGGGILSSVMMNCPTVGSAMEKLSRYHDLTTDFVQLCLNQQGEYALFSWNPVHTDISLDRHHSEAVLCGLGFMLRGLTEGQMQFVEIRFSHPRPRDTAEHQRIFGCPLVFEQPSNELVLRHQDLALPIFLANPELLERLEQFAQELLDRLYAPDTWADRVTHLIGKMLSRGEKPMLDAVARELAISTRHLQNKLKEEGTTYRAILDQLRKEIAIEYLNKPEVTIYDVAFLLGFSEQSAFNHAFKRWTGSIPTEYQNGSCQHSRARA